MKNEINYDNWLNSNLLLIPKYVKKNKEFILKKIDTDSFNFENMPKELKYDKEIVIKAIRKSAYCFRYTSKKLKNDKDVVMEAIKQDGNSLMYASKELKSDEDFILKCFKESKNINWALSYVEENIKNNAEIVLLSVKQNHFTIRESSKNIQNFCKEELFKNLEILIFKQKNDKLNEKVLNKIEILEYKNKNNKI